MAGYPRVVVSPMVHEFLSEGQIYSNDPENNQIMSNIAKSCRPLLYQDVDGCWIVDFLGKGLRDLMCSHGKTKDLTIDLILRAAYDFVRSEAVRFRTEDDAKLARRYHLLQNYFELRLPLWGLEACKK